MHENRKVFKTFSENIKEIGFQPCVEWKCKKLPQDYIKACNVLQNSGCCADVEDKLVPDQQFQINTTINRTWQGSMMYHMQLEIGVGLYFYLSDWMTDCRATFPPHGFYLHFLGRLSFCLCEHDQHQLENFINLPFWHWIEPGTRLFGVNLPALRVFSHIVLFKWTKLSPLKVEQHKRDSVGGPLWSTFSLKGPQLSFCLHNN